MLPFNPPLQLFRVSFQHCFILQEVDRQTNDEGHTQCYSKPDERRLSQEKIYDQRHDRDDRAQQHTTETVDEHFLWISLGEYFRDEDIASERYQACEDSKYYRDEWLQGEQSLLWVLYNKHKRVTPSSNAKTPITIVSDNTRFYKRKKQQNQQGVSG
ncbi:MAG: hypothetical protein FWD41_05350 [Actinomycetia bacterium]|nr:hypothetical protein [Actinomycetes bacterium]